MRMKCLIYIKTREFYWAVMIMVSVNTLAIATEHHHQPYSLTILQGPSTTLDCCDCMFYDKGLKPGLLIGFDGVFVPYGQDSGLKERGNDRGVGIKPCSVRFITTLVWVFVGCGFEAKHVSSIYIDNSFSVNKWTDLFCYRHTLQTLPYSIIIQ